MVRVLTVAGLLLVIAQLHRASGSVIASELNRGFGLGAVEIGLVIGAMMFASAVVQVPVGLAFDRYGTRRTVTGLGVIAVVGTLVLAVSSSTLALALGRFLTGAGLAGTITAIFLLAMHWVPPERFTTVAATVIGLGSAIGGLLATAPLSLVIERLGWQPFFLGIAGLTVLVTLLYWAIVRDGPEDPAARPQTQGLKESLAGLRALLADPAMRRILAMGATTIAPWATVVGLWAVPYLQDIHGFDAAGASYVLFAMIAAYNLGTLAYGPLDRWVGGRVPVVRGGALATLSLSLALALWPDAPTVVAVALLLLFSAATPYYVTLTAQCRDLVPGASAGRAITTLNLAGLTGAFAMQWLSGVVVGATDTGAGLGSTLGYRLVFATIALALLAALAAYRKVPERPS